jgi:hypothetical protein
MSKSAEAKTATPGDNLVQAAEQSGEQMMHAWTHGMDLYLRYLTALSQAKKPEDIIVANADLFTDGAATFSRSLTHWNSRTAPMLAPSFPD